MRRHVTRAVASVAAFAAIALQAPLVGAEVEGDWLDRLSALKCRPNFDFDAPSIDPLLFTMIAPCWRKQPRPEAHQGPYSLIAVDAARNELRTVRISAFDSGGIHYAEGHRIIWFSELNQALVGQEQRFIEVFSLEPQALTERSLGRFDLPFVAGYTRITKGVDCHILRIQSRIDDSGAPIEHRFLLFADGDPIGSSRTLAGVEHVLFFEPVRRIFVTETRGAEAGSTVRRAALDCSARLLPLDEALARRLAEVENRGGRYWAAGSGDLLVADFAPSTERTLLFRGPALITLPPLVRCADFWPDECESYAVSGLAWSSSGQHFAVSRPGFSEGDAIEVYRAADLALVHEQPRDLSGAFVFIDDRAVYSVTRRGRFNRDAWR